MGGEKKLKNLAKYRNEIQCLQPIVKVFVLHYYIGWSFKQINNLININKWWLCLIVMKNMANNRNERINRMKYK